MDQVVIRLGIAAHKVHDGEIFTPRIHGPVSSHS